MHKYNREEIIRAAKVADKKSHKPMSQSDFIRLSGIREFQIDNAFPEGGWAELSRLAKIETDDRPMDKQVMKSVSTRTRYMREDRIVIDPNEFELEDVKPDLKLVESPLIAAGEPEVEREKAIHEEIKEFGEIIDFRGLRHAPVNEVGVIFLFGMVSNDLGFMVEAVHEEFPDCEAKRHIGGNRYQRVRIKFEYKSSDYRSHGYGIAGVDIIICWENDWQDCPLEVIELRNVIDRLDNHARKISEVV